MDFSPIVGSHTIPSTTGVSYSLARLYGGFDKFKTSKTQGQPCAVLHREMTLPPTSLAVNKKPSLFRATVDIVQER